MFMMVRKRCLPNKHGDVDVLVRRLIFRARFRALAGHPRESARKRGAFFFDQRKVGRLHIVGRQRLQRRVDEFCNSVFLTITWDCTCNMGKAPEQVPGVTLD